MGVVWKLNYTEGVFFFLLDFVSERKATFLSLNIQWLTFSGALAVLVTAPISRIPLSHDYQIQIFHPNKFDFNF